MKHVEGKLVICDPIIKEIMLFLDSKKDFIIEDLDETRLFVKREGFYKIVEEVQSILSAAQNG